MTDSLDLKERLEYHEGILVQPRRISGAIPKIQEQIAAASLTDLQGASVAFVGMGASLFAGVAAIPEFRRSGIRAHAVSATELCDGNFSDIASRYISLSASGRSRETVEATEQMPVGTRLAITAYEDRPLNSVADQLVMTSTINDSGPCTVSYVGMLEVLGLILTAMDAPGPSLSDWEMLPDAVSSLLGSVEPDIDEWVERWTGQSEPLAGVDVVGRGTAYGTAAEGALLLREKSRIPSAYWDTLNYLHGPMESLNRGIGVVILGDDEHEVSLARNIASYGFQSVLITRRTDIQKEERLLPIILPVDAGGLVGTIMDTVVLQLLAGALSTKLGREGKFLYPQKGTKL